jgi:hypothetical protein
MRLLITILFAVCFAMPAQAEVNPWDEAFKKQWYAGVAEITRYELKQARYRDVHTGDAVLIFVTEDFLTDKQVKHERGDGPSTSVLNDLRLHTRCARSKPFTQSHHIRARMVWSHLHTTQLSQQRV